MLDHRRAGLHEVASVDVGDPLDLADRGVVDVAAHHAGAAPLARLRGKRALEGADEADRVLDRFSLAQADSDQ